MTTNKRNTQVPVTIIGGFLGSGKTTLLNRVLQESSGIRYAVMVNDFGELAIDEMLIREHDGETISFANGCVCCSLGDNLVESIDQLLERDPPPEQFLIEVSGVANPKIIADVATLHPQLRRDLIISLVDVSSVQRRLDDERLQETIKMQLAPADLLVLNKIDHSHRINISNLKYQLRAISPAPFIETSYSQLPAAVLSAQGIESDRHAVESDSIDNSQKDHAAHLHEPTQQFWRAKVKPSPDYTVAEIKTILQEHRDSLVRGKGFLRTTDNSWTEIQFSGNSVNVHPAPENLTGINESVLVLIGVEPLQELVHKLSAYTITQTKWQATV